MHTRICDIFGIDHPLLLGGMRGATNPRLVAEVTNAGALGILSVSALEPRAQLAAVGSIRAQTSGPFGVNHLLAFVHEDRFAASLECRPQVMSTAWPRGGQGLTEYFARAHDAGMTVMHMVSAVSDAVEAAEAGADVIVAQGAEGGGHVGQMSTMTLVPLVVRAVPGVPVVAAGGIADGRGFAAALALGAEGVMLGTRFLATEEASIPQGYKDAIVASDGHDSMLSEIVDLVNGEVWPGAMSRAIRNRLVETYVGREWDIRRRRQEIADAVKAAVRSDDPQGYVLQMGQCAGLIDHVLPAGVVVRQIVEEADGIIATNYESLRGAQ